MVDTPRFFNINKRDTPNTEKMFCFCSSFPGIPISLWSPTHIVDVTRIPFCSISLGGKIIGGSSFGTVNGTTAFYHTHYMSVPILSMVNLFTNLSCLEQGGFDLGYLSEFDPSWNNDFLSVIMPVGRQPSRVVIIL